MLESLGNSIIHLIQTTQYVGIFALMFFESVLIPIPSEVTMSFSGFLAQSGVLNLCLVVIVGTFANLCGSLVCYWIGCKLEETVLLNLIRKYGKFVLFSEHDYKKSASWFKKYGDKVVFIGRLLPGVRTVISLPAGMFEMNLKKFAIYTVAGCFIWSLFLTYIGFALGSHWQTIDVYYKKFELIVVVLLVLAVLWYIDHHLKFSRKIFKK